MGGSCTKQVLLTPELQPLCGSDCWAVRTILFPRLRVAAKVDTLKSPPCSRGWAAGQEGGIKQDRTESVPVVIVYQDIAGVSRGVARTPQQLGARLRPSSSLAGVVHPSLLRSSAVCRFLLGWGEQGGLWVTGAKGLSVPGRILLVPGKFPSVSRVP